MLRLGMLDLDTSHAVAFTQRLNHLKAPQEEWVDGAKVVVACPGISQVMPERIPGFAKALAEEYGVPLVQKPEEMLGKIDALLLEGNDGALHLERARPFLEAGLPVWIDKPLAYSVRDAEAIAELSAKKKAPVFSASSARFAKDLVALKSARAELGEPVAVEVYFAQSRKDNIPGWFFYGIHSVEMLFAILGPGHGKPVHTKGRGAEVVTSVWRDGATGTIVAASQGNKPSGFTYFGAKGSRAAWTEGAYTPLLKEIVAFFQTGRAPVAIEETVETIRFVEAIHAAGGK